MIDTCVGEVLLEIQWQNSP